MSNNIFEPRSTAQNERTITRNQGDLDGAPDFSGGLYNDHDVECPKNGVIQLENWLNLGNELYPRGGSKGWTDTPLPNTDTPHSNEPHKAQEKIVLHIGTNIYVSDNMMTSWTKAYLSGANPLNDGDSQMREFKQWVFIFCNGKIYRIDLNAGAPYIYHQLNTDIPTVKITGVAETTTLIYGRRHLYTLSLLSGSGNRTRLTADVSLQKETGATEFDGTRDYGEVFTENPVDGTNTSEIGTFTMPTNSAGMNFYSLYSSLDTGDNGVDPATGLINQAYKYALNTDIPVAKAFNASIDNAGIITLVDGDGGAFSGTSPLVAGDVGSLITNVAGNTFKIATVVTGSTGTVTDSDGTAYSGGVIANTGWAIGGGAILLGSKTGTTFTKTSGSRDFVAGDVGEILFVQDAELHIITFTDVDNVETAESGAIAAGAATLVPVSRLWTDSMPDQDIRDRIGAWDLRSRFHQPLPFGDIGDVAFGFIFAADIGGDEVVYSQIPDLYEELAGFYKADFQRARMSDAIYAVEAMKNVIAVACSTSTTVLLCNTFNEVSIPETGEAYLVVGGQNISDRFVGTRARASIAHTPRGYLILVTSEPGIRIFDGNQYSGNLAENRIMDVLKQLDPSKIVGTYDPWNGYQWWTYQTT